MLLCMHGPCIGEVEHVVCCNQVNNIIESFTLCASINTPFSAHMKYCPLSPLSCPSIAMKGAACGTLIRDLPLQVNVRTLYIIQKKQ